MTPVERILAYHERTKHRPERYAASPGHLEWATQPDPFRRWEGAPVIELPLLADGLEAAWRDLQRPGTLPSLPLGLDAVALLFELSLGLSAVKELRGSRWALRCNPSSGNLHPTEGYLLAPAAPGLAAGLHHYRSDDHVLERRAALDESGSARFARSLPPDCLLVGLSSIPWREAWKYGERAFRYCQHDVGHAIAALRYAAAALGWRTRLLDLSDTRLAHLLGLDRDGDFASVDPLEREHPDALLLVGPFGEEDNLAPLPSGLLEKATWAGTPNRLSPAHRRWEAIDEAAAASWKSDDATRANREVDLSPLPGPLPPLPEASGVAAAALIRSRRSAQSFDGETPLPLAPFLEMLDRLLPRPGVPPWDALTWPPEVHPVFFVHRVTGLVPGVYAFARSEEGEALLRAAIRKEAAWERVAAAALHLRLFRLFEGEVEDVARAVSCQQSIAADSAFSLGMLAPLRDAVARRGAPFYRRLFWEAGVLGQLLYLEAEAAGVRGTGIGCFFDDLVHELLGTGSSLQSLYHFTVGTPVEDPRLTTLPPYGSRASLRRTTRVRSSCLALFPRQDSS